MRKKKAKIVIIDFSERRVKIFSTLLIFKYSPIIMSSMLLGYNFNYSPIIMSCMRL